MRAHVRDTENYFDVVGAGLVADGDRMRERPVAFIMHGGPGNDHSDQRPSLGAHAGFNDRAREIVAARGTDAQKAAAADLWAGRLDTVEKLRHYYDVLGPLYSLRYDPEVAQRIRGRAILSPQAIQKAFAPGGFLRSFDLRPELSAITAPTLVLGGRHDWICPPEFSEEIHRIIKGSQLRIFEESSHSIRNDEPELLRQTIANFVRNGGIASASR